MDLRDSMLTGRKKTGVRSRKFYSRAVLNDEKVQNINIPIKKCYKMRKMRKIIEMVEKSRYSLFVYKGFQSG